MKAYYNTQNKTDLPTPCILHCFVVFSFGINSLTQWQLYLLKLILDLATHHTQTRCHSLRNALGRNGNGLKKRNFNEQKTIGFSTQTLTEKLCGFLSKFAESEPDRNLKTLRETEQNADTHSCGIEKQIGTEQVCGKNCPL